MSKTKIKSATRALAFAGALSLFLATSASAAFVADGTPFNPGVALTGTANFGGTVVASMSVNFSENFNVPPIFTGTLSSVVVQNGGGTLDFYYQISNIAADDPQFFPADIFRLVIDNFDPFATGVMDYSTNGLAGIVGAPVGAVPTQAPTTADRDINIPNPLTPDAVSFRFAVNGAAPAGDPANLQAGDVSNWMIVRTSATAYTTGEAVISGFGTALTVAFTPTSAVPEPGSALVGLAVMGLCGSGFLRRSRKAALA